MHPSIWMTGTSRVMDRLQMGWSRSGSRHGPGRRTRTCHWVAVTHVLQGFHSSTAMMVDIMKPNESTQRYGFSSKTLTPILPKNPDPPKNVSVTLLSNQHLFHHHYRKKISHPHVSKGDYLISSTSFLLLSPKQVKVSYPTKQKNKVEDQKFFVISYSSVCPV